MTNDALTKDIEDVLNTISSTLIFPIYAGRYILTPLLLLLIFFSLLALVSPLGFLGSILYIPSAWIFSLPLGLLLGLIFLIKKLVTDIQNFLNTTLSIVSISINEKIATKNQTSVVSINIFEEINHVLNEHLIPALNILVKKKIPFIGGLVIVLISRILKFSFAALETKSFPSDRSIFEFVGKVEGDTMNILQDKIDKIKIDINSFALLGVNKVEKILFCITLPVFMLTIFLELLLLLIVF